MSKALVIAVYYGSGAFSPRLPAHLPISKMVESEIIIRSFNLFTLFYEL